MTEERTVGTIATAVVAVVALILAAGALIVNAAGGDTPLAAAEGTPVAAASDAPPSEVAVELTEFAFSPEPLQVAAGGSLVVSNGGTAQHDLEIVGEGLSTPMLNPGDDATLSVEGLAPGTYEIRCTVPAHDTAGMVSTLTVVDGDGDVGGEVAAAADDADASDAGHDHGGDMEDVDWAGLDQIMLDTIRQFPAETEGRGNQLLEPEILPDGTKRFELTAEIIEWEVAPGEIVEGWAYNGQIPGPMIKTDVGDKVQVEVTNNLPMGTDVHWHGILVPNEQDGVAPLTQDLIEPGESYTYEFVTNESAVNMYHPHHHAVMKVPNGMWGVFLVGDLPLPEPGSVIGGRQLPDDLTIDHEIPMVVNDAGTIGMSLNGKSFPATDPIVVDQGDNILLHYYNEGYQIHPMHLHGLPQLVVGKDGFPLDQPYWADTVNVAPGERYSVLVPADDVGVWVFHCHILTHVESDEGMFGMVTAVIVEE